MSETSENNRYDSDFEMIRKDLKISDDRNLYLYTFRPSEAANSSEEMKKQKKKGTNDNV